VLALDARGRGHGGGGLLGLLLGVASLRRHAVAGDGGQGVGALRRLLRIGGLLVLHRLGRRGLVRGPVGIVGRRRLLLRRLLVLMLLWLLLLGLGHLGAVGIVLLGGLGVGRLLRRWLRWGGVLLIHGLRPPLLLLWLLWLLWLLLLLLLW
jgi:hypothetical protein